jgi:hypothetical protein
MFARRIVKSVEFDGVGIQLCKLSAKQLEVAATNRQIEAAKTSRVLGGELNKL